MGTLFGHGKRGEYIHGDSGCGSWSILRNVFKFKGETDNIVKFSGLLFQPKKNVSTFANSPSNIRQHVEVRMESYPFHAIVHHVHGF